MAVEEMKKGYSGDDKEFAADTEIIFSTYLAPESDTKVHVSDMLRDNLQSMVNGEMLATQSEVHRYRTFHSYSNCISLNYVVHTGKFSDTKCWKFILFVLSNTDA